MNRLLLLPLLATIACGSIETTPADEPAPPLPPTDGLVASGDGFAEDPYAPGSRWYAYDGTSHAVTPRPESYLVRRGDDAWLVRILSYYDAQGRSGVVSMELRAHAGEGGWADPVALTTSANIKERPVCVDLDAAAEAPCAPGAELALRTDRRVVPPAGFAVANPAIYAITHADDAAPLAVTTVSDSDLDALVLDQSTPDADAARSPDASRVGWLHDSAEQAPRADVQLQATASMELVQWQVASLDTDALILNVRCAPLASVEDAQEPLSGRSITPLTIQLPAGDASGVYVRLCGEAAGVIAPITAPQAGLWPDNSTFDLIVEQRAGRVAVRPAPGALLHNWTRAAGQGSSAMDPAPAPPAALWE
jgi:hypothetical protein